MRERAFSLIELLVVIAIIGILAGLVFGNMRSSRDDSSVELSALNLMAMVREARQNALAVLEWHGQHPSYGIYLEKGGSDVTMFADCVADDDGSKAINDHDRFDYQSTQHDENCGPGLTDVEVRPLDAGVTISEIRAIGGSPPTINKFSVEFLQPEPTVWFSHNSNLLDIGTIEIDLTRGSVTRTVILNRAGLVALKQ
jgi:prepilin-type N-terminal cleavage/methylation domain-containing protein